MKYINYKSWNNHNKYNEKHYRKNKGRENYVKEKEYCISGHTHKEISQHEYENKEGENVIVTQPGKHGECISQINIELEKINDEWKVNNKNRDDYNKL